jgi:alpha-D-ribose 1-methylphosphonate 5-triphosphate diphosphatase
VLDLPAAWALVSLNPARACGLLDRGELSPGQRGDVVVVDPAGPGVVAVFAAGRLAHLSADGASRLG